MLSGPLADVQHTTQGWARFRCQLCNQAAWDDPAQPKFGLQCRACVLNPARVKQCVICLEQRVVSLPCDECTNGCCAQCLEAFWTSELREGRLGVSCPGCSAGCVNPEKIMIRLGAELPTLLRQARDRYNHANLLEVFEAEPELAEWAFANKVQSCPRCCSLIQLTAGCVHMTCRCAFQFCYTCGGPWENGRGHGQCSRADKPRLSVDRKLLNERRTARRLSVLMATHPRVGAMSLLTNMPSDVLRAICKLI